MFAQQLSNDHNAWDQCPRLFLSRIRSGFSVEYDHASGDSALCHCRETGIDVR